MSAGNTQSQSTSDKRHILNALRLRSQMYPFQLTTRCHSLTCFRRAPKSQGAEDHAISHLFAFLAEGGFAGVATQVITLSAGDLLCGRLQDGWHRGADRPNIAVLSMCAILTLFWSFLTLMGLPSTLDVRQIAKTIVGLPVSWCPFDGVPI